MDIVDNELIHIKLEKKILIGVFKTEHIDLENAQKIVNSRIKATKGQLHLLLANIMVVKSVTRPAREFFASEEGCEGIIATAMITNSPVGNLIGNFYININKPLRPVKLFSDEQKAKKWLLQNFDPSGDSKNTIAGT